MRMSQNPDQQIDLGHRPSEPLVGESRGTTDSASRLRADYPASLGHGILELALSAAPRWSACRVRVAPRDGTSSP